MPSSRDAVRRCDLAGAVAFALLTGLFLLAMAASPQFFAWTFARHHNVLSWYVRPLFLVPFCVFAYRRRLTGMLGTLFLLATSMFWFPAPGSTDPMVSQFLAVEVDYLRAPWTPAKIVGTALVPLTLAALGLALWRRTIVLGLTVLVLMAVLKMVWSVLAAGDAGYSIFAPAIGGLIVCAAMITWATHKRS